MSQLIARITDIKITKSDTGYDLIIPIKSGDLNTSIPFGIEPLCSFLETAINSASRRFGENPSKD